MQKHVILTFVGLVLAVAFVAWLQTDEQGHRLCGRLHTPRGQRNRRNNDTIHERERPPAMSKCLLIIAVIIAGRLLCVPAAAAAACPPRIYFLSVPRMHSDFGPIRAGAN